MNKKSIVCKGCSTKYGNAIEYCNECDGYIKEINDFYNRGYILKDGVFMRPEDE